MRKIFTLSFLILLLGNFVVGQSGMQEGFSYLENGQNKEAVLFFKNYLSTVDSTDRTARLCLGRAYGLSGNLTEAEQIFESLDAEYPHDKEILVNIAELEMWSKNYEKAQHYYRDLYSQDSTDLAICLGYSNALSLSGHHSAAAFLIQKTLDQNPQNEGCQTSYKHINLAYADLLLKKQSLDSAHLVADRNLYYLPSDQQTNLLLMSIAGAKKDYPDALQYAENIEPIEDLPLSYYTTKSYLEFMNHQKKKALATALRASHIFNSDSPEYLDAQIGLSSAYGWNKKYKMASLILDSLSHKYPESLKIRSQRAAIDLWKGRYNDSYNRYLSLLRQDSSSASLYIGIAETEISLEKYKMAEQHLNKAILLNPFDPGANILRRKLKNLESLKTDLVYLNSRDLGENKAQEITGNISKNIGTGLSFSALIRHRKVQNPLLEEKASVSQGEIGIRYRLADFWALKAAGGLLQTSNDFSQVTVTIENEFRFPSQTFIKLGYDTGIQDFTAGLILSEIGYREFYFLGSQGLPYGLGLYADLRQTYYSDDNQRSLLFASLFKTLSEKIPSKVGVNLSTMTFKNQVPAFYFSPEKYLSYEAFGLVSNLDESDTEWIYHVLGALGKQTVEETPSQSTYRFELQTGWNFSDRIKITARYAKSNQSTTTAAGYEYEEFGVVARVLFF